MKEQRILDRIDVGPRFNAQNAIRLNNMFRGHDAADVPLMNSFGQHVLESFRVWCHPVDGSGRELDGMLFA